MWLCLTCYHLWPAEAGFCGHCGRTFGGRLCKSRHLSPASAHYCVECGSEELTEPTRFLGLGLLSSGIGLLVTLACGSLLLQWGGAILSGIGWLLVHVLGITPAAFDRIAGPMVTWLLLLGGLLAILPGSFGRQARRSIWNLFRQAPKAGRRQLRFLSSKRNPKSK